MSNQFVGWNEAMRMQGIACVPQSKGEMNGGIVRFARLPTRESPRQADFSAKLWTQKHSFKAKARRRKNGGRDLGTGNRPKQPILASWLQRSHVHIPRCPEESPRPPQTPLWYHG